MPRDADGRGPSVTTWQPAHAGHRAIFSMVVATHTAPYVLKARAELAAATMNYLVAEVSESVQTRLAQNLATTQKEADALRRFADLVSEFPHLQLEWFAQGPAFVIVVAALRVIHRSIEPFEKFYRTFIDEHGDRVEQYTRDRIEALVSWARTLPQMIEPHVAEYMKALERDLAESAEEQREIANEWSVVIGDGLDG